MSDKPCVTIIGHGFTDTTTLAEWAHTHVQDHEFAIEVAEAMLQDDGTYPWNADQAEFYAMFEIVDEDEFKRQLVALKILTGRVQA